MIITLIVELVDTIIRALQAPLAAVDFHLDQQNWFAGILMYALTLNKIIPITDAVVPIVLLNYSAVTVFALIKAVRFVLNVVRGSGA